MSCRNKDKYDHRSNNGSVDHRGQYSRNEPNRCRKSPVRVQHDWSEHISSKGLIYYYNCQTEISQWQKPQDWTLPDMTPDEMKRAYSNRHRNGEGNSHKRHNTNYSSVENDISPKRIKMTSNYNPGANNYERKSYPTNNAATKSVKSELNKLSKSITCQSTSSNNNTINNVTNNCKVNDDDMDISPGSSPLSQGSASDCDKKTVMNEADKIVSHNNYHQRPNTQQFYHQSYKKSDYSTHNNVDSKKIQSSSSQTFNSNNVNNTCGNDTNLSSHLTSYQLALVHSLRSVLHSLKTTTSTDSSLSICLSVYQISDLLMRVDVVLHNGETANSYRSHRLHAQLSQDQSSSIGNSSCDQRVNTNGFVNTANTLAHNPIVDSKTNQQINSSIKTQPATLAQLKDTVKSLQQFIQEQYPSSPIVIVPVSPSYSKSNRVSYYLQIFTGLVETCLQQLCPQSLNSPSSTSSPGSLKDNTSNISVSTSINSNHYTSDHINPTNNHKTLVSESTSIPSTPHNSYTQHNHQQQQQQPPPHYHSQSQSQHQIPHNSQSNIVNSNHDASKKDIKINNSLPENDGFSRPKSILQDSCMLKYVSSDVTNTYRNNLADCYEKEAQIEYYKFVRLHSVLYSDLACESKKLKALVKISEINTELLSRKKDDLEKLIQMLESRRLPSHLRCDYVPSGLTTNVCNSGSSGSSSANCTTTTSINTNS